MGALWIVFTVSMIFHMTRGDCVTRDEFEKTIGGLTSKIATLEEKVTQGEANDRDKRQVSASDYVAFSVFIQQPGLASLGTEHIINFDSVATNLGNAYDAQLSVFTAKTPGHYVFSLSMMSRPNDSDKLNVAVNGVDVFNVFADGNEHDSSSRTVVLRLAAGDKVWVRDMDHTTNTVVGNGFTSFSGWLLYPESV